MPEFKTPTYPGRPSGTLGYDPLKGFCLVRDPDSHWYVIPADLTDVFDDWSGGEDYESGDVPSFAERVDHPANVTFPSYHAP